MKILKTYYHLIPIIATPLILICGIILWFFSGPMVQFFKIHWLVLAIALIISFTPIGKIRLANSQDEPPKYRPAVWLAQIFLLQVCVLAVFLGISSVCGETAPVLTNPHPLNFQKTLSHLFISEGLFPWAWYALIAVCFGFYSYYRQQDAYLATISSPYSQNTAPFIVINFIGRFSSIIAYAVTFGLISLLWASVLTTTPIVTGFSLTTLLVTLILMVISFTKLFKRNIRKVLGVEIPVIPGVFSYVVFLAVGIWLLNGFLAPISNIPLKPPGLLQHWIQRPWQDLWMIFANSWWLLLTPVISMIIAKISRGYRIREVLLVCLALPLLLSLALGLIPNLKLNIAPVAVVFIAGLGLVGFLIYALQPALLSSLVVCVLPKNDDYKFRSYQSLFIKILQIPIIFLFVYLPSGVIIWHFLMFSFAIPVIVIGLAGIAKLIYKH